MREIKKEEKDSEEGGRNLLIRRCCTVQSIDTGFHDVPLQKVARRIYPVPQSMHEYKICECSRFGLLFISVIIL
jgi:hypothetical protein